MLWVDQLPLPSSPVPCLPVGYWALHPSPSVPEQKTLSAALAFLLDGKGAFLANWLG
jgi:hypothetical protein